MLKRFFSRKPAQQAGRPAWTLRTTHPLEPAIGTFSHPSELLVSLAHKTGSLPYLDCDDPEDYAKVKYAIDVAAKDAKPDKAILRIYYDETDRLFGVVRK